MLRRSIKGSGSMTWGCPSGRNDSLGFRENEKEWSRKTHTHRKIGLFTLKDGEHKLNLETLAKYYGDLLDKFVTSSKPNSECKNKIK